MRTAKLHRHATGTRETGGDDAYLKLLEVKLRGYAGKLRAIAGELRALAGILDSTRVDEEVAKTIERALSYYGKTLEDLLERLSRVANKHEN